MNLIDPKNIESELLRMWDSLSKEKVRACLFNLIIFHSLSPRTPYIRDIVQKVSEKYPCRVLFISADPKAKESYLQTAVSVLGATNPCEIIEIHVAGHEIEQVPFILFPHIIPDLPVSLLWTEDPSLPHPLFKPLTKLASRVIFDSESADSLPAFSKAVLALRQELSIDTADLNWARTEGWRDLLASLFRSGQKLEQIHDIRITHNARATEFFCHLKVQSLYLLAWLSSCLGWKFKKSSPDLHFEFTGQRAEIHATEWEKLGPGTIISVDLATEDNHLYQCARVPAQYHSVNIQISCPEKCELPYQFILGQTATGQSLVKEIITQGTSAHYLQMLQTLLRIDV